MHIEEESALLNVRFIKHQRKHCEQCLGYVTLVRIKSPRIG